QGFFRPQEHYVSHPGESRRLRDSQRGTCLRTVMGGGVASCAPFLNRRPPWQTSSLLALLLCVQTTFALDLNSLKPQGYVSDFANVIDADTRAKIENYAARVEHASGVQMAFVTLNTLDGEPIEDVANTLYRKWGVGKKGKDEGIMLLLAIQDRKDRIEVGYGLEPILPDGFVGGVLREVRPLLQQQQYGQAMLAGAEEMGSRISAAKGVALEFSS